MAKNTAVFGLYATPGLAENAVDHLIAAGFRNSDISVLLPDDESTRAFAHEKSTKAPEGTAAGAATGGVIGGTLGLLAGIGMLAIPGVGPMIAAGPIMAALAGLGAGGAVGGLVGALVGMGIPEYEAKRFEGSVKNGGTLLSVHCETSEFVSLAKRALKETGAKDIASSGEESSPNVNSMKQTEATYEKQSEATYELNNAYLKSDAERGVEYERVRPSSTVVADRYDPTVVREEVLPAEEDLAVTGQSNRSRHYPPS
jgi:hypothetical protein